MKRIKSTDKTFQQNSAVVFAKNIVLTLSYSAYRNFTLRVTDKKKSNWSIRTRPKQNNGNINMFL